MVRREGNAEEIAEATVEAEPCCTVPAGESPVREIAGEPGSRPALEAERPTGEAWCRKPSATKVVGGEPQRGPQHQVNPAASSELRSESRAEHVAVKAMFPSRESGWEGRLGGVWGAARAEGTERNTRDPSAPPTSGRGRSYKRKAKSSVAQRESEGVVVPLMAATKNAVGGKDPYSGCAAGSRKCWGMTETARSNHPREQLLDDKARERFWQLWIVAKQSQDANGGVEEQALAADARGVAPSLARWTDASHITKTTGKPCAGNRHARFERRWVETGRT